MHLIKLSVYFIVSVLIAYTLASVAHTQQVLAGLLQLGVQIPLGDRLFMFAGDWAGLYLYLLVIALGFLIAFVTMALMKRIVSIPAPMLFAIGGALAMLCILVSMRELASLTPIAGARGMLGFSLQCLAGAVGGGVFGVSLARLTRASSIVHRRQTSTPANL